MSVCRIEEKGKEGGSPRWPGRNKGTPPKNQRHETTESKREQKDQELNTQHSSHPLCEDPSGDRRPLASFRHLFRSLLPCPPPAPVTPSLSPPVPSAPSVPFFISGLSHLPSAPRLEHSATPTASNLVHPPVTQHPKFPPHRSVGKPSNRPLKTSAYL